MAPRCFGSNGEICGIDIDDALSHDIPRVVKIRDMRLGCLYYFLVSGAVVWIVVYQLLFNLRYLRFFEPNPSPVRLTLQQPTAGGCSPKLPSCRDRLPRIPDLTYCCMQGCSASSPGFCHCPGESRPRCNCEYVDGFASAYIQESTVFVTTMDAEYNQVFNSSCHDSALEGCDKLWLSVGEPNVHCVAGIEAYTLMLDHTLQQDDLQLIQRAGDMLGYLYVNGDNPIQQALCEGQSDAVSDVYTRERTDEAPCFIPPRYVTDGTENILDIGTMMEAMGVTLDSSSSYYGGDADSLRFTGMSITIQINYFNTRPWLGLLGSRGFFYVLVPGAVDHFRHTEVVWRNYPSERHVRESQGLHFSVMPAGAVAAFDFNMLIITLTTGLTFLATASVGVRFLALKLMMHRSYYKRMVVQQSCDFSAVYTLEALSEEELTDILRSRHLSTTGPREARVLRLLSDGWQPSDHSPVKLPMAMAAGASMKRLTTSFGRTGGLHAVMEDESDAASSCSKFGVGKSRSFNFADGSDPANEDPAMEAQIDCGELHDVHRRLEALEGSFSEVATRLRPPRRLAGPELDIFQLRAGHLRVWLPLLEVGVAVACELPPLFDTSGDWLYAVPLSLPTGVRLVQGETPPDSASTGDGADGIVAILEVTPGGAAAAAGVLPGDVLRAVSRPAGRSDVACSGPMALRCDGLSVAEVVQAVQANAKLPCNSVTFCLERPPTPPPHNFVYVPALT